MNIFSNHKSIKTEYENQTATITLNRPDIHNAFNAELISELYEAFENLKTHTEVKVIVLTGSGKSFCSGADLNWMKNVVNYSYSENYQDSLKLAELLYCIYSHPLPVIAKINGSAIGGGVGLSSACDIAVANDKSYFQFSEVKLGLTPAVISPYIINRIGQSNARWLFMTAERIDSHKALQIGLVNEIVQDEDLDNVIQKKIKLILSAGHEAVKTSKKLVYEVSRSHVPEIKEYTAELISNLRLSREGQEGMNAFLEKRKPDWIKNE